MSKPSDRVGQYHGHFRENRVTFPVMLRYILYLGSRGKEVHTGSVICLSQNKHVKISNLHFCSFSSFDNRHSLPSMNSVGCYGVSIQVSDRFHSVCFSIKLNFIGFHNFLNSFSNITQSHINSRFLCVINKNRKKHAIIKLVHKKEASVVVKTMKSIIIICR